LCIKKSYAYNNIQKLAISLENLDVTLKQIWWIVKKTGLRNIYSISSIEMDDFINFILIIIMW